MGTSYKSPGEPSTWDYPDHSCHDWTWKSIKELRHHFRDHAFFGRTDCDYVPVSGLRYKLWSLVFDHTEMLIADQNDGNIDGLTFTDSESTTCMGTKTRPDSFTGIQIKKTVDLVDT